MALANAFIEELTGEAATTRRVLERVPEEKLSWKPRGSRTLLSMRRIAMVRSVMLNHWYHHRGQLLVYLRLLDVSVPSVYGPSADENPFM